MYGVGAVSAKALSSWLNRIDTQCGDVKINCVCVASRKQVYLGKRWLNLILWDFWYYMDVPGIMSGIGHGPYVIGIAIIRLLFGAWIYSMDLVLRQYMYFM